MRKVYAIGDIHGHSEMLGLLLGQILPIFTPEDKLVFLGDYIDRGPDSPGVVLQVLGLKKMYGDQVVLLWGNHEDMAAGAWKLPAIDGWVNTKTETCLNTWIANGGDSTTYQFKALERDHFGPPSYLEALIKELVPYYYDEELGTYFVHAGIPSSVDMANLTKEDLWNLIWFRPNDLQTATHPKYSRIVVGHTPTSNRAIKRVGSHLIIDTGSYYPDGKLTCIALSEPGDGTRNGLDINVYQVGHSAFVNDKRAR